MLVTATLVIMTLNVITALLNTDAPLRSPGERNVLRTEKRSDERWGIIPWWGLDLPLFPLLERSLDQI